MMATPFGNFDSSLNRAQIERGLAFDSRSSIVESILQKFSQTHRQEQCDELVNMKCPASQPSYILI